MPQPRSPDRDDRIFPSEIALPGPAPRLPSAWMWRTATTSWASAARHRCA